MADAMTAPLPSRFAVIAAHAVRLTRRPADITEADLAALRAHGLDDRAIVDLTLCAAYFNFVNRVALGLGVAIETGQQAPDGIARRTPAAKI